MDVFWMVETNFSAVTVISSSPPSTPPPVLAVESGAEGGMVHVDVGLG